METRKTAGRPALPNTKQYKVKLPQDAAEWAKQQGGLSELLRDCLQQRFEKAQQQKPQTAG